MSPRHGRHGTVPTAKLRSRSRERSAIRLTMMVAVIVVLASVAVWQGARLIPAWAAANARRAVPVAAPAAHLLQLIDAERERAGCGSLSLSEPLTVSAEAYAADMAIRGYASESGPEGVGPQEGAELAGYRGHVAAIVAAGIPTPGEVLAQWTNRGNSASAGIVAKMTDCGYVSVGIGYDPARVMATFLPGIWVVNLGDS
jgi:uncharacterized protein YkwD